MVSGGADSACAPPRASLRARRRGRAASTSITACAPTPADGEAAARALCATLRIDLHVERPDIGLPGNLQAAAREVRYDAAERLRKRRGGDWIATGHTRTDLAETFSTGSPSRPAPGRCSDWRRATAGSSGPCSSISSEEREPSRRRGFRSSTTPPTSTRLRPQPDPRRGAADARRVTRPSNATWPPPTPSCTRRRSCSAASCRGALRGRGRRRRHLDRGGGALRWEPGLRRLALRELASAPRPAAWRWAPRAAQIERLASRPRVERSSSAAA